MITDQANYSLLFVAKNVAHRDHYTRALVFMLTNYQVPPTMYVLSAGAMPIARVKWHGSAHLRIEQHCYARIGWMEVSPQTRTIKRIRCTFQAID